MEVHLPTEQEAQPAQTARFRAAVREGIAQADQGKLIDDDEVRQWLEQKERS